MSLLPSLFLRARGCLYAPALPTFLGTPLPCSLLHWPSHVLTWPLTPPPPHMQFWGSEPRRAAWQRSLAAAQLPAHFSALITLLEEMLLGDSFKPAWRMWSLPAQHPALVGTWEQLRYRWHGLQVSIKGRLPTAQQVRGQAGGWVGLGEAGLSGLVLVGLGAAAPLLARTAGAQTTACTPHSRGVCARGWGFGGGLGSAIREATPLDSSTLVNPPTPPATSALHRTELH